MKKIQILLVALMALAISCGTLQKVSTNENFTLEVTSWQLSALNSTKMQPTEERYTLAFNADNALNARGECNIIFGSYEQSKGNKLKLSPAGSTRSACPNMDIEAEFMETLTTVTNFEIINKELHLLNEKNVVVMTLQAREHKHE